MCFGGVHVFSNGQVVALMPGWRCLTPSIPHGVRCRDMLQVFSDGSFLAPMLTSCRLTPSRPPPQHRALGGYRQAGRFTGLPLSAPAHALADPWVSLVSGLGSCVVGALPDRCVSRDATNVGKTPASRSLLRRALCRPVRLPGRLCHVGVGTTRLADPKLRPDPLSGEVVDRPLPAHFGSLPGWR